MLVSSRSSQAKERLALDWRRNAKRAQNTAVNATGQTSIESCICKAPDYFQHAGKCVEGCPPGWFRDLAARQCRSCDGIADGGAPGSTVATVDCAATMEAAAAVDAVEQALVDAGCSRDVVADAEDAACTEPVTHRCSSTSFFC